jgi:hypothetical protein
MWVKRMIYPARGNRLTGRAGKVDRGSVIKLGSGFLAGIRLSLQLYYQLFLKSTYQCFVLFQFRELLNFAQGNEKPSVESGPAIIAEKRPLRIRRRYLEFGCTVEDTR